MDTLLAQTDWLKDYDPLFDLFDEEMSATGQANFASDQYCDYDLTPHRYCPYKIDELSIFLDLERMPCLDFITPESSLISQVSVSHTNTIHATNSSKINNVITQQQQQETTVISNNAPTHMPLSGALEIATLSTSLSSSASSSATSSAANSSPSSPISATSTTIISTYQQQPIVIKTPTVVKRKKKTFKPKGTSLLAQPSSRSTSSTTCIPLRQSLIPSTSHSMQRSKRFIIDGSNSCSNLDKLRYRIRIEHDYSLSHRI